jgi:hypothetical protein
MAHDENPLLADSDKAFWHGYIDFYESLFPKTINDLIVEFGVFKGNSIKWLRRKYPSARIVGADILPVQPEWPSGDKIEYKRLDQGSEDDVQSFFREIDSPALIIEDGSHIPSHQSRCLRHGLNKLRPGGIYVVEDIHTSLPQHPLFKAEYAQRGGINRVFGWCRFFRREPPQEQTCLSVLLALEHIQRAGRASLTEQELNRLATGAHFSKDDILRMHSQIRSIHVYRRATLPMSCFACGESTFNYHALRCVCGCYLLSGTDSMSVLVVRE